MPQDCLGSSFTWGEKTSEGEGWLVSPMGTNFLFTGFYFTRSSGYLHTLFFNYFFKAISPVVGKSFLESGLPRGGFGFLLPALRF